MTVRHNGAVVKTIGDAIMAAFVTPPDAVSAALKMRSEIERLNEARAARDFVLKIGIHRGPSIAVTLNDRLDYFGQTVNIASRVQGLASSRSVLPIRAKKPILGGRDPARNLVASEP